MIRYYSILIGALLFFSCSDDDPSPGCFQEEGRRIVSSVNNIEGTIVNEDCGYLLNPDSQLDENPIGLLFPCNLDAAFEIDESRILFSGFIYESFDTEDICADFFEITEIQFISDE